MKPDGNLYARIPLTLNDELCEELAKARSMRIERIVSHGHTSPDSGWYEQDEHEWVIVTKGSGTLLFEDGREVHLISGDYYNIPQGVRHKVSWTDPNELTVWLAVFYR